MSLETWNRFRSGKVKISPASFIACCQALGLKPNELQERIFAQPNLSFLGRDRAIESINALVKTNRLIVIYGVGGQGKTTLAQNYLQGLAVDGYRFIELYMPIDAANIPSAKSILDEWFNRDFQEMPSSQFGVTLDRLRRIIREQKIAFLIDNIESLLDENGKFITDHAQYLELFSVLSDHSVKSMTLVTSRCRLLESRLRSVYNYAIPSLSQSDWQDYFTYNNVNFDEQSLAEMYSKLGGNAKAMTSLCGEIYVDFDRDATNFWKQRGSDILASADLKDLVAGHLERLVTIEPLAYGLLRRMGCYRYQSIPYIPIEALFYQLWDSPEASHIDIIEVLKNRSLLELANGEYSLHPIVRAEAVRHLKQNEEEFTKAHHRAADFWKAHVQALDTDKDILMAFEPCYHYLEINALNKILEIFLRRDLIEDEHLHMAFYGRFSPTLVLELLDKVEERALLLPPEQGMSILALVKTFYGSLYLFSGQARKSVLALETAIKLIEEVNSPQLIVFLISNIFHIIACKMELGEFEEAIVLTKQYINNIDKYKSLANHPLIAPYFSTYPQIPQSFMLATELDHDASVAIAEEAYASIVNRSLPMSRGGKGFALMYLGFVCLMSKRFDKALEIYNTTLKFSHETSHRQLEGKAMYGLAETYRNIGDLTKAKEYCLQSKNILMKIESKLDLAKVLVEEALIAREMREHGYQDDFEKAIALFTELNAPKHVERVRKLMG
ncbi:tetratricopeptide repeat protein [Pseudanabaena biceps]|uniref:tetratricopeptide repeat protein n=1 Tax=Pseudanabaena biceps TaxID=927669 RepID=UPI00130E15D5|nr:AAA family ATPase [Pseudanabaena biceps]